MTDEYFEPNEYYKDLEDKEYIRDSQLYEKRYKELLDSVQEFTASLKDQIVKLHNQNWLEFECILDSLHFILEDHE